MQPFPPTIVIRHRLENLKKCSLRGLESRSDFRFFTYPYRELPPLADYIVLALDAPPLTKEDVAHGILLIDATWRYAAKMMVPFQDPAKYRLRSLPSHYRTAYPRRQEDCSDPERGLASIEALFLCYHLLGRDTSGLLDYYYWKILFLQRNNLIDL